MDEQRKTAYGIVCKVCGHDKEPYQFFVYSGKYDRKFFVTGFQPGVCWDCAGPYACVICRVEQPASEYRVQGRICNSCKEARRNATPLQKRAELEQTLSEGIDSDLEPFAGVSE